MSHEIRTPMNAIMGMTYLALQTDLDDKQRNYIVKAHDSAENLLSLINDILDFSKIEAGKMELENNPFELKDVISSMLNMISFKAKEKNLQVSIKVDKDVPRWLIGDALRLSQVLINLGTNAVKFSNEGGKIVLNVALKEEDQDESLLLFSLHDEGIGISSADQERLFGSFAQANSATTRKYGGTGLGLKISKNICELMNGTIWVESSPGEGSTFSFTVRLKKQEQPQAVEHASAEGSQRTNGANLHNATILLVEDNELNQELAIDLLNSRGASVIPAENGEEGIAKLKEGTFDAILMDIQMPVMDGFEAARRIRLLEQCGDVPIIALTAGVSKDEVERIYEAGMNDYISKPINPKHMFLTLEKWIK